jgi:hypothetical protein
MRRFSIPVDEKLFKEYDEKVIHGIKATLIRGLIRIALESDEHIRWAIAQNEGKPGKFEIREKST